jgi:hypothetical protein
MVKLLKKQVFFLIFFGVIGGLYALDFSLSAGGGFLLGYTFTRYTLEGDGYSGQSSQKGPVESAQTMDRFDFGGFVFLDATYAELAVSLMNGTGAYSETLNHDPYDPAAGAGLVEDEKGTGYEMMLGISLMGKYPFALSEKWALFPMLGAEYLVALAERRRPEGGKIHDRPDGDLAADLDKDERPYPLSAWNSVLIKIGAGADYTLTRSLFLRGEFFYGFRLQTKYETGALEMVKDRFNIPSPKFFGLTSGPSLRIALGYCFL